MQKVIQIFGHIDYGDLFNEGVKVSDIAKQLENENFTSIHVQINSPGGGVVEGRAIRAYLNSLNVDVTTEAFGECSSIATEIFLMGKERIVHEGLTFLIHFPSGGAFGTAEDIANYNADLLKKQEEMIDLYFARAKGKLSREQIAEMMRNEKTLSAQELLEFGFATKIIKPFLANSKNNHMKKITLAKAMQALGLKKFFKTTALDLELNDGTKITVVTEAESIQVGDAVVLTETGEPAPDGEHTLSDGTIIIVSGGVISEIKEAQQAGANVDTDFAELVAVLAQRVQALEKQQENWAVLMKNAFGESATASDFKKVSQQKKTNGYKPQIKRISNVNS